VSLIFDSCSYPSKAGHTQQHEYDSAEKILLFSPFKDRAYTTQYRMNKLTQLFSPFKDRASTTAT